MAIQAFFKRNWVHFAAIGLFLLISMTYFSKQLQGYGLKQHDIEQHKGISREIAVYREHHNGQEPLWSNSMFGGMPTMQTSTIYHGNWFSEMTTAFIKVFPSPMGIVLLYMLCFYVALIMLRVNKWVAIIGAVAFAFLSYDIVLLQAGHNSKGVAIAFMAPVVGAFIMAFRRSWIWGALLSAVFMAFEMSANHLQVTYYLGFLLLGLGITEVVRVIKNKNYGHFIKAAGGIVAGYFIALLINYGNIRLTADYAEYSIRGANDLTINANGTSNAANSTGGLKRDYVVEYSLGKDESFSLVSPYVKGAGSMLFANSPFVDRIENNSDLAGDQMEAAMNGVAYWGEQPAVSGPVYLGVILVLLAFIGMYYIKDPMKYALLAVTILTLMLSWGKNFMGLTNWFLDHVPGYDKFRAVTIILVIVELCIPLLAILFLDKIIKEREAIKANMKPFYIISASFFLVLLIVKFMGLGNGYLTTRELKAIEENGVTTEAKMQVEKSVRDQIASMDPAKLQESGIDKNNPQQIQQVVDQQIQKYEEDVAAFEEKLMTVQTVREDVFNYSMNRSLGFAFLAIGVLLVFFLTSIPTAVGIGSIGLLIVLDLMFVSRNYINNQEEGVGYKHWDTKLNELYPMTAEEGDAAIMDAELAQNPALAKKINAGKKEGAAKAIELGATASEKRRIVDAYAFAALNENTNYRVFDYVDGFNSARSAYFHKSLGGYHGAKLRNIQNLIDFHLGYTNNKVINMMNVRYFLMSSNPDDPDAPRLMRPNPEAMGNGWFVQSVRSYPTANDEIRALGSRYEATNVGTGKLIVNEESTSKASLFGAEKLQYLMPGSRDTLSIGLSNGVPKGLEVFIVQDKLGTISTVPEQTIKADTANSFVKLVAYKVVYEFEPAREAVVGKDAAAKLAKSYKGTGTVKLNSYAPNQLSYTINASDKGLVVFSEIYYPEGWTATINGKPADIHRVNYLLRGLEVPKGTSKVVFSFDLEGFHKYNTYSMIASLLILLTIAGYGVLSLRRKKETTTVTETE